MTRPGVRCGRAKAKKVRASPHSLKPQHGQLLRDVLPLAIMAQDGGAPRASCPPDSASPRERRWFRGFASNSITHWRPSSPIDLSFWDILVSKTNKNKDKKKRKQTFNDRLGEVRALMLLQLSRRDAATTDLTIQTTAAVCLHHITEMKLRNLPSSSYEWYLLTLFTGCTAGGAESRQSSCDSG